jgi:hypothetical protein
VGFLDNCVFIILNADSQLLVLNMSRLKSLESSTTAFSGPHIPRFLASLSPPESSQRPLRRAFLSPTSASFRRNPARQEPLALPVSRYAGIYANSRAINSFRRSAISRANHLRRTRGTTTISLSLPHTSLRSTRGFAHARLRACVRACVRAYGWPEGQRMQEQARRKAERNVYMKRPSADAVTRDSAHWPKERLPSPCFFPKPPVPPTVLSLPLSGTL